MRASRSVRGRHADLAYALDRVLKDPVSAEDVARATIDVIRLALRPSWLGLLVGRSGGSAFHCGDEALFHDLDGIAATFATVPRALLASPRTLVRRDGLVASFAAVEKAMAASALELLFPLAADATLTGVLVIGPRADHVAYSADDIEFCDRIGARLAAAVAKEALAAELVALRNATAAYERLASVGQIAAGLAHEIRNPLVSIRTFTQLLPERYADEEFRSGFLDLTLAEIDRISALVGELLSYARPTPAGDGEEAAAVDVADCLERTCLLLRSHARAAGVLLDLDTEGFLPLAAIDEDKLRQVVINLVVNGIQACDGRGRVSLTTSWPDAGGADGEPGAGHIVIEVRDDGPGMDPDVAARIFEPFFTTRREGTGLGLALVRRILDENGASISVETRRGEGTTFRIGLPPVALLRGGLSVEDEQAASAAALDAAEGLRADG